MPTRLHRSRKLSRGWVVIVDRALFQQRKGSFIPSIVRVGAGSSEPPSPSLVSFLAAKGRRYVCTIPY